MSGIPTPRPSKLAAPGSIARSTTSAISRTAAAPAIAPKKGLKRLNGEEKASDAILDELAFYMPLAWKAYSANPAEIQWVS